MTHLYSPTGTFFRAMANTINSIRVVTANDAIPYVAVTTAQTLFTTAVAIFIAATISAPSEAIVLTCLHVPTYPSLGFRMSV